MSNSELLDVPELKSTLIDRSFNVRKLLGTGAYGKVYEIQSKTNENEILAVKCMASEYYERETEYLLRLEHPNIIKILNCGNYKRSEEPGRGLCFIVMEKCTGNLFSLLTGTPSMKWSTAKSIMYQILSAVSYLHKLRLMHRDIKPDNILVTSQGQVKLTDFGDCILHEINREYTLWFGSLWYMAPEVLQGNRMYNLAVDMWSVGCVFLIMVTYKNYFMGDTEAEQLNEIQKWCKPQRLRLRARFWNWWRSRNGGFRRKYQKALSVMMKERVSSEKAADLIDRILEMDPVYRITARAALMHPLFQKE